MRWMQLSFKVLVAGVLVAGLGSFARAQEAPAPDAAPSAAAPQEPAKKDPQAVKVIDGMQSYFEGLKSVKLKAVIAADVKMGEQTNNGEMDIDIAMKRPGKMKVVSSTGDSGAQIGSDGTTAYIFVPELKQYMDAPAPASLSVLVLSGAAGPMQTGATFVAELFEDKPYERLLEGVTELTYVGEEEVDGVKCDRLHVAHPQMTWDMWVEKGDQPWLIKAVPDVQSKLAEMGHKDVEMNLTVTCKDWEANPELSDDLFTFTPPADVKKVEQFGAQADDGSPSPLLGKPAPEIKLDTLDGGTFDLASYKGKKIVLLDFWATYCPPCKKLMPILSKIAADYADKDVVFCTVNGSEDADMIKAFLENLKLDVPVALDKDGAVNAAYGVVYIPRTVIVGKDGTVQVVHEGAAEGVDEELQNDLDGLIKGDNLAAATIEAYKAAQTEEKATESEGAKQSDDETGDTTAE